MLNLAYYLQAYVLVMIVEANELESGSVDTGANYFKLIGKVGQVKRLKVKLIYYL